VADAAPPVDPHLAEVEEDAVVERALGDVAADLRLVRSEILIGALGVEHERVGDEVDRGEVRLDPAPAELWEVPVRWEPEDALHDRGEDRLGEHLLV
jgi:hypothetical protein